LTVLQVIDKVEDMSHDPGVAYASADLRRRLAEGEWTRGDQFPTFDELSRRYPALTNIYRIRTALAPLIQDGLIESRHGAGSFVLRVPDPLPSRSGNTLFAALDLLDRLREMMLVAADKLDAIRVIIEGAAELDMRTRQPTSLIPPRGTLCHVTWCR
jgi:DNA-binding FadR family transcriptional regulator